MPYPRPMAAVRNAVSALLSKGVISPGSYAVLTGVAMLAVVWLIAPVAHDDPAVPVVALVMAVGGIWSISRGVRLERERRRPPTA